MRVLIAGWFSFPDGHATAGDILAGNLIRNSLIRADVPCDLATTVEFDGNVQLPAADPRMYDVVVFVCGPFENKHYEASLFERFAHCRFYGVDLSMIEPIDVWNPFDYLVERDSPTSGRPDIVFAAPSDLVPVAGVCLVEDYPDGDTGSANRAISKLLDRSSLARLMIDTRLDQNEFGLRCHREIEAVIARLDVLLTTRLHGMVLALKHGVPVIAIDPVPGGAKIVRQGQTIGWPHVFAVDRVTDADLDEAVVACQAEEARGVARACADRARREAIEIVQRVTAAIQSGAQTTDASLRDRSRCPAPARPAWWRRIISTDEDR